MVIGRHGPRGLSAAPHVGAEPSGASAPARLRPHQAVGGTVPGRVAPPGRVEASRVWASGRAGRSLGRARLPVVREALDSELGDVRVYLE